MDVLYIGDIPKEYHYAIFNNGYIDLYNTDTLHNNVYTYYRIYTNCGGFYYKTGTTQVGQYTTTLTDNVSVTDNLCYRNDFDSILFITFILAFFGIWLFNIITSIIRKGGLLGGLI